ncbi:glycosyltransferase 87 family protein [Nocardioides sp.]|uniref:glycosyltransferase 87 family protein n=1 Tax=Nocardioides sp. TaxID=35761 RepID=UPI002B27BF39|nr:glycosyltransferase 87 family protein [Nocardioides sp.]
MSSRGGEPAAGHVHPTVDDRLVAALSEPVGGPVGSRARARSARDSQDGRHGSWWTPVRVLLGLTALTFALGLVVETSCVSARWSGDVAYSHLCTSEVAESYTDTGLVEGTWPWDGDPTSLDRHPVLEEPALTGLWAYAAARVTHVLAGAPELSERYAVSADALARDPDIRRERVIFVGVNAIGFAVLALLTTWALSLVHRRRPWDAAGFAVAPVLVVTGLSAWHLLAVSAVALALLAWSRGRAALAGVAVGVGAAAGVWPVLLLIAFALSALRTRRVREVLPCAVAALATWAALNAPAFVSGRAQWERFWAVAADRGPDAGTFWTVLDGALGDDAPTHATVLLVSWVLVGVWVAAVVAFALLVPAPPRVSQVALLLVAGFVLLRPSFEPHQALWLLPLAALARPRWRDLLVWQGSVVLFAALHSWWLGGLLDPGGNGPPAFYWLGIGVHVVGTLWLVACVVGDVWWDDDDPVAAERRQPAAPAAPPVSDGSDGSDGSAQVTTTRSNDVVV